jgi:hypothetical protein
MFRKAADGSGPDELIRPSDRSQDAHVVSRERNLLIFTQVTTAGFDIWSQPLTRGGDARPIVEGPSVKTFPALSPDGRWLAYQSNESGREEVYVVPFPVTGKAQLVSRNGGAEPRWRADGKELFFIAGGSLMAVPIDTAGSLTLGGAAPLFPITRPAVGVLVSHTYAAARDGKRFLTMVAEGRPVANPITVMTNWLVAQQ